MKKFLWGLLVVILFGFVACVNEPIAWYWDQGVIEMSSDTVTVNFNVPDPDTNGWHQWESGDGSQQMTVTLTEKGKKDVVIDRVVWRIYTLDRGFVASYDEDYIPPILIEAKQDLPVTVTVTINEGIADDLDDATGDQNDFLGQGYIEFSVEGYDIERGNEINCIPSYTLIQVQR